MKTACSNHSAANDYDLGSGSGHNNKSDFNFKDYQAAAFISYYIIPLSSSTAKPILPHVESTWIIDFLAVLALENFRVL